MATVKKTSVPPTHPTVWLGLGLAVIGLLMAVYSYTGARVYSIAFAIVALAGAFLALVGIMVAAWGRSIMAARASRSRRANFQQDAMSLARPVAAAPARGSETLGSEDEPTIAAPKEKKRFSFGAPKEKREAQAQGVFAFKRRAPEPAPEPERARDDPRNPEVAARLEPDPLPVTLAPARSEPEPLASAQPVRVTLRCPQCSATFAAEGVRPFTAVCASCGFRAEI